MPITKDLTVWNKLKKNFRQAETLEGQLGWFEEDRYGSDNDNLQMATVAHWQEEGTAGGQGNGSGIPPRPVMRVGLRLAFTKGSNQDDFRDLVRAITLGKSPLVALKASSEDFKKTLRKAMDDWNTPPNAQSTIENKGFNDPWIETGQLQDGVNFKVGKKGES